MIDVIIPYIPSNWDQELKYALRSWEMYFKEDFEVTIIGDRPEWITNVKYIHDAPINIELLHRVGALNQLRKMRWLETENKSFVWSNDDIYLLQDVTTEHFTKPYMLYDYSDRNRNGTRGFPFLTRVWNTIDRCRELGLPKFRCTTHMPIYYDADIYRKVFELFGSISIEEGGWVSDTAYINFCQHTTKDPFIDCKTVRLGVYNQSTPFDINENTLFLNHNDSGLNQEIKDFLKNKFPNKSKFELQRTLQ